MIFDMCGIKYFFDKNEITQCYFQSVYIKNCIISDNILKTYNAPYE